MGQLPSHFNIINKSPQRLNTKDSEKPKKAL